MDMTIVVRALACALALASGGAIGATQDEATAFRTPVKLVVDEAGRPVEVEASSELPAPVREFVESSVRELKFGPAMLDGQPMGGTTYVVMGVCAVQRGGDLVLAADYRGNGPVRADGVPHLMPPRYPAKALRRGQTGKMEVDFVVETDGSATLENIDFGGFVRSDEKRTFEAAIRDWVKGMRYLPEQLAGQPVRTRMNTTVEFILGGPGPAGSFRSPGLETLLKAPAPSPECLAAEGRQPAGLAVSSQSLFLLDPG